MEAYLQCGKLNDNEVRARSEAGVPLKRKPVMYERNGIVPYEYILVDLKQATG
jgi:hypothetical protein